MFVSPGPNSQTEALGPNGMVLGVGAFGRAEVWMRS